MKKLLALLIVMALIPTAAFAADVLIVCDGEKVECVNANGETVKPFIEDGTTYLPVRAIANTLKLEISWDDATKSVVIGEAPKDAKKGENVNIFIDGEAFTAKDVTGKVVYPILKEGTTYLPVRAIGEAFGKSVEWDGSTATVTLTTPVETAAFDGYYYIKNVGTGKYLCAADLSAENNAAITTADKKDGDDNFVWRLGATGGGFYSVINAKSGKSIDVPSAKKEAGVALIQYTFYNNSNQNWKIEAKGDAYTMEARHSQLYVDATAQSLTQENANDNHYQEWTFEFVRPSMLKSVLESEGYKAAQPRIQRAFKTYFFRSIPACMAVASTAEAELIASDYNSLDGAAQTALLEKMLTYTAYGQVNTGMTDMTCAKYEIIKKEYEPSYDIWRGDMKPCWLTYVKMEGDAEGEVHEFKVVSNQEETPIVQRAIEALGVFPYAVRRYVDTLYWKQGDPANSYNGGGHGIWIRLEWEPNTAQIAQTFAHELGHILDTNQLESPQIWSNAESADACPVSSYGSSNQMEDLAEFHRLYWTSRGTDFEKELEVVYPNRIKVFRGLLYRADKEYFKDFADDEKFIEELKAKIEDYNKGSAAEKIDTAQIYKIVDAQSGKAFTVKDASKDNNIELTLADYTGGDHQKFIVERTGDTVKITALHSESGIQMNGSALSAKSLVQYGGQWAIDDKFRVDEKDGGYIFTNGRYDLGISAVGDAVLQTAHPSVFKLESVGKIDVEEYTITLAGSDECIVGGEKVAPVTLAAKDGSDSQIWVRKKMADGEYAFLNKKTGFAFDILDISTLPGASLITWDLTRSDNQIFTLEEAAGGVRVRVKNSKLYLTATDGKITQEELDASKKQLFTLEKIETE